jgi:SAM-dependent methyltransferase
MPTLGTAAHFTTLRNFLRAVEFTEPELCRRYGIAALEEFELESDREPVTAWDTDAAGVLFHVFVDGRYVGRELLERFVPRDALESAVALGLLETDASDSTRIASAVALYPCSGLLLISDRWNHPDRLPFRPAADVVYPAIVSNAQRFLRFLPDAPCDSLLDVGTGSGVAALIAAGSFAKNVVATDIAERAVLHGDLYAPVAGRSFDRIVAHPPYVPALRPKYIYQDGGEDGEGIVRRVVSEAPPLLAPGGSLYLMAVVSDRDGEPFEERVRTWLGESNEEFDVAVFPFRSVDPDDFAARAVLSNAAPLDDYRKFRALFTQLRVRQLVYVVLLLQRRADGRQTFTIRRQAGARITSASMAAMMRSETELKSDTGFRRLLTTRLRANESTRLTVPHTLAEEGWEPSAYLLSVSDPFTMEARTEPWATHLLAYSDGTRTVAETFGLLIQQGVLPESLPPEDFARAVAVFVSGGFLQQA